MSAQSAGSPIKGKAGAQNPLALDDVAPSASPTLSWPVETVMRLADSLNLTIDLQIRPNEQWLELKLEDELNLSEVNISYPVRCMTLDRAYHLREALVIGVRRLIQSALDQQIISGYPGELSLWSSPRESVLPMDINLDEYMPSLTDLDVL